MENINIYWFSGTGNSLRLAKAIRDEFTDRHCNCILHPIVGSDPELLDKDSLIGLVFPVAVQSTYPLVWEFISNLPETENTRIFMADTMAEFSGGIVGPLKRILTKKGYDCVGAREFIMPSCMAFKEDGKKEEKINVMQVEAREYVIDILNGISEWNRIPVASDLMRSFSLPSFTWSVMARTLKVDRKVCNQCGLCFNICPVACIRRDDEGSPVNNPSVCNSCLRCLNFCPLNAYKFIGRKFVQNRGEPINELVKKVK